jgi:hypothetical protein
MNQADAYDAVALVKMLWPHSDLGPSDEAVAKLWFSRLVPFEAEVVVSAITKLSDEGREFAPPLGVIVHRINQELQDPPPSFEDMMQFIGRHGRCLPYRDGYNTPEDTALAIECLARKGAHEAILRFVAEQGVWALRTVPDGSLFPLDMNQQADRRDKSRHYEHRTVPDWRVDPTPGLALARTQRRLAKVSNGDLRRLTMPDGAEEES